MSDENDEEMRKSGVRYKIPQNLKTFATDYFALPSRDSERDSKQVTYKSEADSSKGTHQTKWLQVILCCREVL